MKQIIPCITLTVLTLTACHRNGNTTALKDPMDTITTDSMNSEQGYADVNGLKFYYERYGEGKPLVLIHGGGSTIQSSFASVIPLLAKHRQVIGVELQAHGRTSDRDSALSFEQDADDVAELLRKLAIDKADFLGFSNGGTTALQIAIRHPKLVNRMIVGSALSKRNGVPAYFWEFMEQARLENMPEQLQEAYLKVAADPSGLRVMHDKDANRMVHFKDIPDQQIKSITAPVLIIIGDKDIITPEHAIEMHRLIPHSQLAIIPGGHGEYIGEVTTLKSAQKESDFIVPMMERFLDEQED